MAELQDELEGNLDFCTAFSEAFENHRSHEMVNHAELESATLQILRTFMQRAMESMLLLRDRHASSGRVHPYNSAARGGETDDLSPPSNNDNARL